MQYPTGARFSEVLANNFSGPESCFKFSVFAFKIKVSDNLTKGENGIISQSSIDWFVS